MKFIVFGLGNYGSSLATKMVALGHEVIGVDHKVETAEKWKDAITHTIALDASNPEAMENLPLKEVDGVIVAIGETPGISIMIAALLKQFGVDRIICRVISPLQRTVLESMQIKEFVYPEADSAERMAYRLDLKGVRESFKVADDYQILEVDVPHQFIGSAIGEISFSEEYEIHLISIIREGEEKNIFGVIRPVKKVMGMVLPTTILQKGDRLLLFGEDKKLEEFIES